MQGEVRKSVEEALDKLKPGRAQELARGLAKGEGRERVSEVVRDLSSWSSRNRERVRRLVAREVRDQLKHMGLATHEEVQALRKRVRELERSAPKGRRKDTSASTSGAKAKTSGAERTPTERTTAKRVPTRTSEARTASRRSSSKD